MLKIPHIIHYGFLKYFYVKKGKNILEGSYDFKLENKIGLSILYVTLLQSEANV